VIGGHWDTFVKAGGLLGSTWTRDSRILAVQHGHLHVFQNLLRQESWRFVNEQFLLVLCALRRADMLLHILSPDGPAYPLRISIMRACAQTGWVEGVRLVLASNGEGK